MSRTLEILSESEDITKMHYKISHRFPPLITIASAGTLVFLVLRLLDNPTPIVTLPPKKFFPVKQKLAKSARDNTFYEELSVYWSDIVVYIFDTTKLHNSRVYNSDEECWDST